MTSQVVENLTTAKALVEKGWTKGAYSKQFLWFTPRYCMLGALKEAGCHYNGIDYVEEAILDYDPSSRRNVIAFNDHPNRTKEEVLKVFDIAIAKANKGE